MVAATEAVAELAAGVRAAGNVEEEDEEEAGGAAHTTARTSARTLTQHNFESFGQCFRVTAGVGAARIAVR